MEYGKIVSVTGLPGLFELVSSKNDGAIVRSLEDKSTKFVSSRIHNFSHLESIEIYTVRDNVNLVDVFTAMGSSSDKLPDGKDNGAIKKYFENVFPDLDFERVYTSDMKKIVKWFSILKGANVEIKLREFEEEQAEEETPVEEVVAEKPAKKAAKKEEAPAAEAESEEKPKAKKKAATAEEEGEEKEEKPKKKAAPKAKKEEAEGEEKPKAAPKKKAAPAADKEEKAEKKTKK